MKQTPTKKSPAPPAKRPHLPQPREERPTTDPISTPVAASAPAPVAKKMRTASQATAGRNAAASAPPTVVEALRERLARERVPAWVLLPLRLFLGITFVYAGLQKLTDPQFFDPHAARYIGRQLVAFARNTPLHGFLTATAIPHAAFFGGLVAYGELAIGLGVLLGLLLRPAAFFGALLSFIFFLSASWNVRPYFYGPDIVFFFAWLPIILAGPAHLSLPAVDNVLIPRLLARLTPARRARVAPILAFVLGTDATTGANSAGGTVPQGARATSGRYRARPGAQAMDRRDFLWGAGAGALSMLGLAWLWTALRPTAATTPAVTAPIAAGTATEGATATGTASTSIIAKASDVATNSAVTFTLPRSGDPGVLVRTSAGKLVAFDAVCTHQGCTVNYDPSTQLLQCPCHGAAFDPTQSAVVVQGPAQTPLASVAITVDQSGDVTLAS